METKDRTIICPLGKDRAVTIDPARQFGEPCVRWRVPTACLYGMFSAGEPINSIADCYELPREMVEDAVQYEVMRRCGHGRRAIKKATETKAGD